MSLYVLCVAYSTGCYTFPFSGVVNLLELSLAARRENRSLTEVFEKASVDPNLLKHLEDSNCQWFHRHLTALADAQAAPESMDLVPQKWRELLTEFWEMAHAIDGEKPIEIEVFLSYSRRNLDLARDLAEKLRDRKLAIWHDELESRIGDAIPEIINRAIGQVSAMVVLVSQASMSSSWVHAEVKAAVNRGLPLFPLLVEDCEMFDDLQNVVNASFHKTMSDPKRVDLLVEAIVKRVSDKNKAI